MSNVSCQLLPNKCIFCDKKVKYLKRKQEFLRKCVAEQAKSKILKRAKEKNDFHLTALALANDLIAAEAQYHPSIQTTLVQLQVKMVEKSDYQKLELEAFQ